MPASGIFRASPTSCSSCALYLELQQKRFADRLTVALPVRAGPAARAWVPSLILQPLVENAVVHGLAGHQGPVTVRVEVVRRAARRLMLRVANTIAPGKAGRRHGIGLKNVRERLGRAVRRRAPASAPARSTTTVDRARSACRCCATARRRPRSAAERRHR